MSHGGMLLCFQLHPWTLQKWISRFLTFWSSYGWNSYLLKELLRGKKKFYRFDCCKVSTLYHHVLKLLWVFEKYLIDCWQGLLTLKKQLAGWILTTLFNYFSLSVILFYKIETLMLLFAEFIDRWASR